MISQLIKKGFTKIAPDKLDKFIMYLIVGMLVGARTFYVFIYNFDLFPWEFFSVWNCGLSFHGAFVGMIIAAVLFAKSEGVPVRMMYDTICLAVAPGLFFGRIGNFINGELYGRITSMPWGVVFPDGGPLPRHPSQLYEAFFEGIVLFFLMWFVVRKRVKNYGTISCVFVLIYAVERFVLEFFREPDVQMGRYFFETVTMGQILCSLMIILAVVSFWIFSRHPISIVHEGTLRKKAKKRR